MLRWEGKSRGRDVVVHTYSGVGVHDDKQARLDQQDRTNRQRRAWSEVKGRDTQAGDGALYSSVLF